MYLRRILPIGLVFFALVTNAATKASTREEKLQALEYYLSHVEVTENGSSWPTIGFELEGIFPGASREEAFYELFSIVTRKIVPTMYRGRKVHVENYDFKTRRGEPRKGTRLTISGENGEKDINWYIKDDGSILPPPDHVGVELVSAILRGQQEILNSYGWIRKLKKKGFAPEPNSAAFQVHAGFTDNGPLKEDVVTPASTVSEVMLMLWVFSKIEKELMIEYGTTPSRKKFTMPTPQLVIHMIESGSINVENVVLSQFAKSFFEYRYWALNIHALFQFGTLELRIANSTVDVPEIESLVDFMGKLVRAVRSKNPKLIDLLREHIDDDIPLAQLAEVLHLKMAKRLTCNKLLGAS